MSAPEAVHEGGCLCGAVRYRAEGVPSSVTHCHCTLCRRASGAPLVTWATFAAARFRFTGGSPAPYDSSRRAVRHLCPRCGTQLTFQRHDLPHEVDVTVASMDDPARLAPRDHVFVATRLPWLHVDDRLPRFEGERPGADG